MRQVIGLKYKNKMCGSFGYVSTFSFYANKQITSGEGGMISTNDLRIYKSVNHLEIYVLVKNKDLIMMMLDGIIELQISKLHLEFVN